MLSFLATIRRFSLTILLEWISEKRRRTSHHWSWPRKPNLNRQELFKKSLPVLCVPCLACLKINSTFISPALSTRKSLNWTVYLQKISLYPRNRNRQRALQVQWKVSIFFLEKFNCMCRDPNNLQRQRIRNIYVFLEFMQNAIQNIMNTE